MVGLPQPLACLLMLIVPRDLVQPEHEHVRAVKIFRQFVKERNFQRLPGDLYTMESPTIDGLCIYWKPDAID